MDHVATLHRMYELITAHDIDGFCALLADDFVEHEELPEGATGAEGVKRFFEVQIAAFPDMAMTIEDVIDGGEKIAARVRLTGTQTADFMGIPATGKAIDVDVIDVMRFGADGLVHEHWGVADQMAMMRQLEVVTG